MLASTCSTQRLITDWNEVLIRVFTYCCQSRPALMQQAEAHGKAALIGDICRPDGGTVFAAELRDVLKSGANDHEPDYLEITLRFALRPLVGSGAIEIPVNIKFQQHRRVIAGDGPSRRLLPTGSSGHSVLTDQRSGVRIGCAPHTQLSRSPPRPNRASSSSCGSLV